MKRIVYLLLGILLCLPLAAQDDLESMSYDDIEIEGFENVWMQTQLIPIQPANNGLPYERIARPRGGNSNFLNYVQKYWMRMLQVISDKYPVELLNRQGNRYLIMTQFKVDVDGKVEVTSIYGGKVFGFDALIAQKMFNDYKIWRPAVQNDEEVPMSFILKIDISL